MADLKYLLSKTKETLNEEGPIQLTKKVFRYAIGKRNPLTNGKKCYKDVLFINGCTLPHPTRYRVDHQIEQLLANGYTADSAFYGDLTLEQEKYYKTFIFFRCPITNTIKEFIAKAKSQNKIIFYDIDDLVFDKEYTKTIKHLKKLNKNELNLYYDGVKRMGDTLKLCDYAITTTPTLANELKKYVKDVFVNRNVASEKMVELSMMALKKIQKDSSKVMIGYLSGSITHNADFELVLPVIKKLMNKYDNIYLKVVGLLDIPEDLKEFSDRIISIPFVSWKKLPQIISEIDINLAPLENSIFNEAKSENKWLEAALCKVVTVASNVGAFKESITNNVDGILCNNEEEWFNSLEKLVTDSDFRNMIATNAYNKVIKNNVTTYTGYPLTKFITSKLPKTIAFVLPTTNISGGVNVILKHCSILKNAGVNVLIINSDKKENNIINNDGELDVISNITSKIDAKIDMMVASLWTTLEYVRKYPKVLEKAYLVQNFETDFMKYGDDGKLIANSTYSHDDIKYITISRWCQNWLEEKYDRNVSYVRNGINVERFPYVERNFNGKIKILVEGNSDDYYKNVDESFKIVDKLDKEKYEIHFLSYQGTPKKWYYVDQFMHRIPYDEVAKVYQNADILIKSSILESFSYPPLEMMATGGICVVVPNDGNIEYLKNEDNCLFYERGNIQEAVDKIERIVKDKELRQKLIKNGKETVKNRNWKSIEKEIIEVYIGDKK
ncbi:MAG: glycosyltransferase [bacterium]|nr:glycosyltransferase [bacterium]